MAIKSSVFEIISLRKVDLFSLPKPEKKINFLIEADFFIISINSALNVYIDFFKYDSLDSHVVFKLIHMSASIKTDKSLGFFNEVK